MKSSKNQSRNTQKWLYFDLKITTAAEGFAPMLGFQNFFFVSPPPLKIPAYATACMKLK